MTPKKPYTSPQLYRVPLDSEQAILSACSLSAMSVSNGGGGGCRPASAGNCKNRGGLGNRDSGPRAS
ncbi:MAG: hypothetical protein IT389_08155 [Nitrospira sp.]|nr:hypothetical protein [Nitrospira sp.]